MISFRTRGNFIDFVLIEDTTLQDEHVLMSLHNTSKAIDWSYDENPLTITFTINEKQYSNIPISSIDFDGTTLTTQAGFETGIEAMFTNIGGGGVSGSVLSATVELTDDEIKTLPSSPFVLIAGETGKAKILHSYTIYKNTAAGAYVVSDPTIVIYYNNIPETSIASVSLGLDSTTNQIVSGFGEDVVDTQANIENKDIVIVGVGDVYTGGNAANTLKVTVYYVVVDL